ncbi:MAG: DMT family transporter [Candidatus Spechtbacterales bacterium]
MSTRHTGIILILISALMFGSYGVWSRLIGDSFEPFYQGWTRALIISVVLLPILLSRKQLVSIRREDLKWLAVFLIFTSLTQAPLFYAFNHMDIGTATLLFFVTMLLTMYSVGFLFLGEKINKAKLASFVFAVVGLYIIFSFSLVAFALFAALLAVLNGFASGGEVAFSKKISGKYSPLYLVWLSWIVIFITNALVSFAMGEIQHLPSLDVVWVYQAGYTVASIIGFWFIIQGLKYAEASVGGLLGLLEILFSISMGILLFGEMLTPKIVIGGSFILLAASFPHIVDMIKKVYGQHKLNVIKAFRSKY